MTTLLLQQLNYISRASGLAHRHRYHSQARREQNIQGKIQTRRARDTAPFAPQCRTSPGARSKETANNPDMQAITLIYECHIAFVFM